MSTFVRLQEPAASTRIGPFASLIAAVRAPNPRWLRVSFVIFLYATVAAVSFDGFYRKWGMRDDDRRFSFKQMVDGTAHRPFVHRQLLPKVANLVEAALPASVKEHIINQSHKNWWWEERPLLATLRIHAEADRAYLVRYFFIYFSSIGLMFMALLVLRQICLDMGLREAPATIAPALFGLSFTYLLSMGGFFYDFSEMFFFALALWLAQRGKFLALIPVTIAATYNKEAFLFFTLALLPLLRAHYPLIKSLVMTGVLGFVSGVTYLIGSAPFRHNPGGAVESWFVDSVLFYLDPRNLIAFEVNFGIFTPRCYSIVGLGLIAIVFIRGWPKLSKPLKQHSMVVAAVNLPLVLIFCGPGEMRNFSLCYMAFFLSLAEMVSEWMTLA